MSKVNIYEGDTADATLKLAPVFDIKLAGKLIHQGVLEGIDPPDTPEGKYAKTIINALREGKTQTKFYNGTFYMNYENGIAIIPPDNSYKRFIAHTWVDASEPEPVQTNFVKPSYEEQLAWLDQQGESAMVRAIKENVIAVRLHETVMEKERLMILKLRHGGLSCMEQFLYEKETNR